jgi:hypothetical protein
VGGEPGEGALDHPPAGDHREPTLPGGFAHDVQGGGQDGVRSVEQSAGEAAVGEHEPHPGTPTGIQ